MLPCFLLGGALAIVLMFAIYVGIDAFAGWVMGNAIASKLVMLVLGVTFLAVAILGTVGIARGRAPTGTSPARLVLTILVLLFIGLMGVGFLVGVLAYQPAGPAGPAF